MKKNSNWKTIEEEFRDKFYAYRMEEKWDTEEDKDYVWVEVHGKDILEFFKPYFQEQRHTEAVEELEQGGLVDTLNYNLGYRDALAGVLAENKNKIKLPDLAVYYAKCFLEEHFSHEWHTK